MDEEEQALTVDDLRLIEGTARESREVRCPVCTKAILGGQDVVTSLGDVRRGAVGVTLHQHCFTIVGKAGIVELMIAAFQKRRET